MKNRILEVECIPTPILFPETIKHVDMARNCGGECVSAGFVDLANGTMRCYGESLSLKLKSREVEDTEIILYELGCEGK